MSQLLIFLLYSCWNLYEKISIWLKLTPPFRFSLLFLKIITDLLPNRYTSSKKMGHCKFFFRYMQILSAPFNLPPEWLLRIDTHLHCSTLVSLLLEPNTVLGPMYLIKIETVINRTTSSSPDFLSKENQLHSALLFYVQLLLQWKLKKKISVF